MDDRDGRVCQPTGLSPRNRVPRHVYGPGAILSRMRLVSADQASVELRIARYQFPGRQGQGNRDWDANWLQVAGTVVLAGKKTWSFEDPCMTTWEAAELGRWLKAVADGAVQPSPFGKGQDEQLLVFTEPNVAFSLQERVADRVRVRIHFSLEALPPCRPGSAASGGPISSASSWSWTCKQPSSGRRLMTGH